VLLTTTEVAGLLRVHPKHVYRLLKRGLPARRVGDEWRFDRDEVLAWSAQKGTAKSEVPALIAANGDIVIELLLDELGRRGSYFGWIRADHQSGTEHLRERRVLSAGTHEESALEVGVPVARLHLVEREIGIVSERGKRLKRLSAIVGRRLALRPATAGIRAHFDRALEHEGVELSRLLSRTQTHDSHRDVALAVARGDAEHGLATAAWADRTGLAFFPIASEPYGMAFRAESLGHPKAVALCELAASTAFKQTLTARGYRTRRSGRIELDAQS
jgi:excisionase family DNA binding protein